MQEITTRAAFDQHGRALPLTPEEEHQRAHEAIRALDALAEADDDEEQRETFESLIEAIDRDRMSDRRRFAE